MNILVVTAKKSIQKAFSALRIPAEDSLQFLEPGELQKKAKGLSGGTVVYIDISGFPEGEGVKQFRSLVKKENLRVAVIDPGNTSQDPAEFFLSGAVDYLGKSLLSKDLQLKRIKAAWYFKPFAEDSAANNHLPTVKDNWVLLKNGWKGIEQGKEYTFCFLYVEIDMVEEWKKKSGRAHIDKILDIFHRHIEKTFVPYGGKIWMWMNHGGLVLFPFNGENCTFLEACLRLVLNRRIISIEEYGYNTLITYKMAVHIGNTIYKTRGETGEIISDSINFLFHIGKKYAEKERFYVTESVKPFMPQGLAELFKQNGDFEGVKMYSLRLPKK